MIFSFFGGDEGKDSLEMSDRTSPQEIIRLDVIAVSGIASLSTWRVVSLSWVAQRISQYISTIASRLLYLQSQEKIAWLSGCLKE